MKHRILFFYLLLTLIISGCFTTNQNEGLETQTQQPYPNISLEATYSASECAQYDNDQLTTKKWVAEYVPSIAINSIDANTTDDVIIMQLFCQWLQHFKTTQAHENFRLNDYVIHRIEFLGLTRLAEEYNVESTALIIYSVKPDKLLYSHWVAGNGIIENEWVSNKSVIVGLYTNDGFYKLKLIGGP